MHLTIIDLPLEMAGGQLSHFTWVKNCANYVLKCAVESEVHYVLRCPLCNCIRYRFLSLFHDVVLDSLSF